MEPRPRVIAAPPRLDPVGSALVLAAIGTYAAALFVPATRALEGTALVACALAAAALIGRRPYAVHPTLLLALITAWLAFAGMTTWPLHLLVPLLAWGAATLRVRPLRGTVGWVRPGRLDRGTLAWGAAIVLGCPVVAWGWVHAARVDAGALAEGVPTGSTGAVLATCVGVALVDAVMKEAIWRGVLLEGLDAALGPGVLALLVQGVSFGVAHASHGAVGALAATAFGVALGTLRRRAGGMLAPVLAHTLAEASTFVVLGHMAH